MFRFGESCENWVWRIENRVWRIESLSGTVHLLNSSSRSNLTTRSVKQLARMCNTSTTNNKCDQKLVSHAISLLWAPERLSEYTTNMNLKVYWVTGLVHCVLISQCPFYCSQKHKSKVSKSDRLSHHATAWGPNFWLRGTGLCVCREGTAGVTLQGFIVCGSSSGLACGDPEPEPSACDSGSRSKSCSSGISNLPGLVTVRRCLWFLRTMLKGVWMMYDLGAVLLTMTFPGIFHRFCWSNFTRTESPGCRSGRVRTPCLLSKYWRYAVFGFLILSGNCFLVW